MQMRGLRPLEKRLRRYVSLKSVSDALKSVSDPLKSVSDPLKSVSDALKSVSDAKYRPLATKIKADYVSPLRATFL